MRNEGSKDWSISCCGLNCAKCDIYQASHGNEKLRNELVEWFLKERNEVVEPELMRCEGCRSSLDAHWSADCKMMLCAKTKNIQYCFECKSYPCKLLKEFASDGISHHKRTVENLKEIEEMGLDAWVAEQKKKGEAVFCP